MPGGFSSRFFLILGINFNLRYNNIDKITREGYGWVPEWE
jgi:hypothetical protein